MHCCEGSEANETPPDAPVWSPHAAALPFPCPGALVASMIKIQVQTLFGQWVPYQTKSNERDAYRVASKRADVTGKRHRLIDSDGRVIDIIG